MARKQVVQTHHVVYADRPVLEWTVRLSRGEHFLISQLQRFGSLSDGAVTAILFEVSRKPRRVLVDAIAHVPENAGNSCPEATPAKRNLRGKSKSVKRRAAPVDSRFHAGTVKDGQDTPLVE